MKTHRAQKIPRAEDKKSPFWKYVTGALVITPHRPAARQPAPQGGPKKPTFKGPFREKKAWTSLCKALSLPQSAEEFLNEHNSISHCPPQYVFAQCERKALIQLHNEPFVSLRGFVEDEKRSNPLHTTIPCFYLSVFSFLFPDRPAQQVGVAFSTHSSQCCPQLPFSYYSDQRLGMVQGQVMVNYKLQVDGPWGHCALEKKAWCL